MMTASRKKRHQKCQGCQNQQDILLLDCTKKILQVMFQDVYPLYVNFLSLFQGFHT